jgi:two-component system sensor histidine kinase DesK
VGVVRSISVQLSWVAALVGGYLVRVMSGVVVQRNAAVLIWVPVVLAGPLAEASRGSWAVSLALAGVAASACVVAVLGSWPVPTARAMASWCVLAAAVLLGCTASTGWSPGWLLVAMTAGVALPPRPAVVAVVSTALAAAGTLGADSYVDARTVQAFMVALAGTTAGVLNQLLVTTETLRRTRRQLAVAAVTQERERVARDLHDVLGHTLSVMVVKASAVRRLARVDPDAVVVHATDIEQVGRSALSEVRRTIQNTHRLSLEDEIHRAGEVLRAAGIDAVLPSIPVAWAPSDPAGAGEPLAWALREGVTNVLRHSGAGRCAVRLEHHDDSCQLTITDDGAGVRGGRGRSAGGLDGLRTRLELAGGGVETHSGTSGFTLRAWVPRAGENR